MATGTSYHNPHFHVDGLVILQIMSDRGLHIGRSVAWMEVIHVYRLHPMLVRPCPCIHKTCEIYTKLFMVTDPACITTHTPLGID